MIASGKHWKKLSDYNYELWHNELRFIELKLNPNASGNKAEIYTNNTYYTLQRTGFWKNTIVISDANNYEVLRSVAGKWQTNKLSIAYAGEVLQGEIRNNPLAELVLSLDKEEIISYSLAPEASKAIVKIHQVQKMGLLLDAFCMFIYLPIIEENTSDNFYNYFNRQDPVETALFIG